MSRPNLPLGNTSIPGRESERPDFSTAKACATFDDVVLDIDSLSAGLEALRRSRGLTKTEVADRMGVAQSTVSKMTAGKSMTVDNLLAWLRSVGANFQDLAAAMAEASGNGTPGEVSEGGPSYGRPSPVSHLAELDYAPRPIDLYQDTRRILREAQRIQAEAPSEEAERSIRSLERAVADLGDLFDRQDAETARKILDVDDSRLTDEEFNDAMRLLKSLLRRAVAEEEGERRRRELSRDESPDGVSPDGEDG